MYYAPLFQLGRKAARESGGSDVLLINANEQSTMHGTHIYDVASAYVAIANADLVNVTG